MSWLGSWVLEGWVDGVAMLDNGFELLVLLELAYRLVVHDAGI